MSKLVEKIRPNVQSEVHLRSKALERLNNLTLEEEKEIIELFKSYTNLESLQDVLNLFIEAIASAQRSQKWRNLTEINRVNMGFYSKTGEFYTLLFHESTHYVLNSLSLKYDYENNSIEEEFFCWCFSRKMCEILNLEYSFLHELMSTLSMLVLASIFMENKKMASFIYEVLQFLEKYSLGYNDDVIGNIEWNDLGQPLLK